jgi:hypothetical protein
MTGVGVAKRVTLILLKAIEMSILYNGSSSGIAEGPLLTLISFFFNFILWNKAAMHRSNGNYRPRGNPHGVNVRNKLHDLWWINLVFIKILKLKLPETTQSMFKATVRTAVMTM